MSSVLALQTSTTRCWASSATRQWRAWTVPLEGDVDVDLLLFGHCLYEMACGHELSAIAPTEGDLLELPIEIADVLRVIFHGDDPEVTVDALLSFAAVCFGGPQ